jgi:cobalamin biosynthesis protein CbiD
MPQRVMIDEVRLTVDRLCSAEACTHLTCASARVKVHALAVQNPHNFWSTKVLYNIGTRRLTRVLQIATPPAEALARVRVGLVSKSMRSSR